MSSPDGVLIFGVGSLHHLPFRAQRLRILRRALDIGFRNFDVAPAYGNGLNEVDLGLALNRYSSTCRVTTKFGIPIDLYGARHPNLFPVIRGIRKFCDKYYGDEYKKRVLSPNEMVDSLEGSLRRLKRDYVDDFLIHEPLGVLTTAELSDLHQQASRLKEQGKILRWGVCGPTPSIRQFTTDGRFDVFQFPLESVAEVVLCRPRRRIGYGVYRSYLSSPSAHGVSFASFVSDCLQKLSMDLIVASNSVAKFVSLRECF